MGAYYDIRFFSVELLKEELDRYSSKIVAYSKLEKAEIDKIQSFIFSKITFVSEELISNNSWEQAIHYTGDIDEKDTPFVALSIELNAKLWTGDNKLSAGLEKKGILVAIDTNELKNLLK
jgi:predicted nucleic acid-binding protein